MNRCEFLDLFAEALETAAQNAETRFKIEGPRNFKIRLSPRGTKGSVTLYDAETAIDQLYLGNDEFYHYIHVAVETVSINREFSIALAHPGDPRPVPFEDTWNYKSGSGPFKQIILKELTIVPE